MGGSYLSPSMADRPKRLRYRLNYKRKGMVVFIKLLPILQNSQISYLIKFNVLIFFKVIMFIDIGILKIYY